MKCIEELQSWKIRRLFAKSSACSPAVSGTFLWITRSGSHLHIDDSHIDDDHVKGENSQSHDDGEQRLTDGILHSEEGDEGNELAKKGAGEDHRDSMAGTLKGRYASQIRQKEGE